MKREIKKCIQARDEIDWYMENSNDRDPVGLVGWMVDAYNNDRECNHKHLV